MILPIRRLVIYFGKKSIGYVHSTGRWTLFCLDSLQGIISLSLSKRQFLEQMENIGFRSALVIILASLSTGIMFGIQFGELLRLYRAESFLGAATMVALSKEIAPVLGAFIVVGRSGSSMAAEIANMRVNQEIEAMQVMNVDPIAYLVSPRILAATLMVPLLFLIFLIVGFGAAYIVGLLFFHVDSGIFLAQIPWLTEPIDVFRGLLKAAVFGTILATVGCYKGYYAIKSARGVAIATTSAVVTSILAILITDFVISYIHM
ncbi:MAG: ABC transporter permease [Proteobacteria bacterium]|nr:ABC transporter permease [Pseudomonadota bacterium]